MSFMLNQWNLRGSRGEKMKHKKLLISMILIGIVTCSMLPAVQACTTVVDFVIWLEAPEKQVVVDELILKTESLGLVVNPIYVTFDEWLFYAHVTHDYDLLYGPYMTIPSDMDIFFVTYITWILSFVILHDDKKTYTCTDELVGMYMEAMANPAIVNEEYINEMVKIFNFLEKRYWTKQFFSIFVQFETPTSDEWGVPSMRTETLNYNCLQGRTFHDTDLRIELNSIIDRTVFLDYHEIYNPYPVSEVYHFFGFSPYHDAKLPNDYNF